MQVKKYVAPTLKSAAERMKQDLGDDAVILATRILKNGNNPVNKMFELTAGIEDTVVIDDTPLIEEEETLPKNFEDELLKIQQKIYRAENEIDEKLNTPIKKNGTAKTGTSKKDNREKIAAIVKNLIDMEIDKSIIKKIILQLKKYNHLLGAADIDNYVLSAISSMIPTTEFNITKSGKPKVVSLVGPTGVGKTTCIAKLAIISKILHNLNVGLISIDTYRLGAIDQLKVFSDVSEIDMLVAYEPEDMDNIMNEFRDKDIIFIDTAGRSQNNEDFLNKANEFLKRANVDETFLVMSSTSSTKTLYDIAGKFGMFNYSSLIFTKIDEGVVFGNLLNVMTKIKSPAVFLSNGQVIPDDIISADSDYLAKLIYTGRLS